MKKETIPGSTDETGLFTAKNPYEVLQHPQMGHKVVRGYTWEEFEKAHPPLFCYNENNQLVKGVEGLEVKGPVWQYHDSYSSFMPCENNEPDNYSGMTETRQVYIAVQPTEKAERDFADDIMTTSEYNQKIQGKKYNCGDDFIDNDQVKSDKRPSTPLPEAQPLEGVKTAEADIWPTLNEFGIYKGDTITENTSISIALMLNKLVEQNAQFATDARGWNKQLLTDCQELLMNLIALNHVPDEVCPDMNDMISRIDDALKAPSTHSSNEMVKNYRQALSQIRRVEMLTPETEAMINKLLNQ